MDWGTIINNTLAGLLTPTTIAFALAALGLAMHFGFAGLLNFGIAGFMAIGAYGYAISVLTFGFPWWGGMIVGIIGSILFAILLGVPTLRLRGDYLAIVTIAAAEIVRLLFLTTAFTDVTGSADGLFGYNNAGGFTNANPFPPGSYGWGPWTYNSETLWVLLWTWSPSCLCLVSVGSYAIAWGRVIKGIREDEEAIRALGKNVFAYKLQALIIGGIFGGMGGIIYAAFANVSPGVYVTSITFFIWTSLLLGGAATIWGPVIGAVIFWTLQAFLSNILPELALAGILPVTGTQAATLRFVLVGIGLMLLVIYRPQGIFGDKRELTFVK